MADPLTTPSDELADMSPSVAARPGLRGLTAYHSPRVDVAVRLDANESPFPPPSGFARAVASELATIDWHRYPDREARRLREAIAERHGVTPEMVFPANGSNEVIQTLLLAYAGPGRTVVTFEPSYQLHGRIARVGGALVVEGERRTDLTLDPDEIRRVAAEFRPHVAFLTSPNNPTGMIEPRAHVEELLDGCDGVVALDEAYVDFAGSSAVGMVADERGLAVVRTFSKAWGLAALRIGYLIAPRWLVAELENVVVPYHLDAVKQIAGRVALGFADEVGARVEHIIGERRRVAHELDLLDLEVFPSSANFILFRPRGVGAHRLWELLLEAGVLVRDCSGWPRLSECLRVTIGDPGGNDRFLDAMATALAQSR